MTDEGFTQSEDWETNLSTSFFCREASYYIRTSSSCCQAG